MTDKCFHDPNDPHAYAKHRRRGIPQCKASLKAWAAYVRAYRIRTGITRSRLVPIRRKATK